MSTKQKPAHSSQPQAGPHPLIPETYIDVPSQRLYYLSLGLLCQAIKLVDFILSLTSREDQIVNCKKWLFVDLVYCAALRQLRIPRLNYSKAVVLLQIALLWFLDGVMFGGITLNVSTGTSGSGASSLSSRPDLTATPEFFSFADLLTPLGLGWLTATGSKDAHLLGQHTVRMSPISTAEINPLGHSFCLAAPESFVLIPILLNNTNFYGIAYSITPLGSEGSGKVERVNLTAKDLKAIEQSRLEDLKLSRPLTPPPRTSEEYDEYDEEDIHQPQSTHPSLQVTQALVHIRVSKPGIIRLDRVFDSSNVDARLTHSPSVAVVPCPRVSFVDDEPSKEDIRCTGQDQDLKLMIDVYGIPPLSLRWLKTVNGKREQFLVEGIEGHSGGAVGDAVLRESLETALHRTTNINAVPQELNIPLTMSLDVPGTYVYALEEVVDGIGNVIRAGTGTPVSGHGSSSHTRTTRSLMVLRRPAFSFKNCGPGDPASLLIGSEATLGIVANEADDFDTPWEISLKYQPPSGSDSKASKRFKSWQKTLITQSNGKEINLRATAPGDYTITGVRGKWCAGDVLAPETCRVVEKPLPTADIEWKRIHECSGDTGVSASLLLRGTPPFHVQYRMQRDNEAPRESSKTFTSSRGELTLQPERSGHYMFTFVQLSDANYKKVELNGPSIDQLIHPLAAADFVTNHAGKKRIISSCEGGVVDLDIDLRGTGPWNLEIQIVGPQSLENLQIEGIKEARKTIQIPIPSAVDRDGGIFEVNIVSVEDAYKCKRPISVPGVSVKVRRVKASARFYGSNGARHVTVLEGESANLPLRLTGDGPWRVQFRRTEDNQSFTKTLTSPNGHLQVTQKGLYEIIDIADSQCPGSVIADGATYMVDWVPKPSAKLSRYTKATYEPYNGSHILSSICEGTNGFVDLDLSGRPPFQIMYNIAQDGENGGTKLLEQPTFNSIQPHTRFQLQTSNPGRIYYEVKQIGDAAYPLAKHANAVIPRSERLLFEQQVLMRPSARFKNRNRLSHCFNDRFTPLEPTSMDSTILFEGTPPFTLTLSIKNLAASHTEMKTVKISTFAWKIDLPSYQFTSIGPHLVTIESVQDASNCVPAALNPLATSIWVDVAETASIIPFDRREDLCVGEVSQFQLEGIPPWTIGYRVNGKSYTQEAKTSPFSLLHQQPGNFTITTIAHQQKLCKAGITDLHYKVHPLPSALVGHGKRIFQDIHEGDQAEIVFTLVGEPPFTFTYQRSEPSTKKGGRPGKVLETHTVSRVATNEYSIYSALEGTWTVTSISDRYCRYPKAQPDLSIEKQRQ